MNSRVDLDIDWYDPFWQATPETVAIFNFLRTWPPHFTPIGRELTDSEWTAFRYLAKIGAAEGLIRLAYTHVSAGPIIEVTHVRGDYRPVHSPGSLRG